MSAVFDAFRVSAVALDVMASGVSMANALAARQHERLRQLLTAAMHGSAFYRSRLQGVTPGISRLSDLPIVSRSELIANFDNWVTDPELKLAKLQAFTADRRRIGTAYLDKYVIWESSGTSNQPCIFVQDARAMSVYDALEAVRHGAPRSLQRRFDPLLLAEKTAFVGAIGGHFASVVSVQRLRQANAWMAQSLRCFSIMQSTAALVRELNAFAPTVIVTYPTAAALLAEAAVRGQLRFRPKEVWTGGEKLSAGIRAQVGKALKCEVHNSYGASEFLTIGWECSRGRMHANTDWVLLEPVDERGQPTPPGEPSYSTLLTNLANHVQPLIRYDLGDQLIVRHRRCECGSSLPVIEVEGRHDDPLVMAGRDGQPVTLLPLALTTVLEEEAEVYEFQLRQRDERTLVLRLDIEGPEARIALARCRVALRNFAAAQGVPTVRIVGELGKPISKGRSGKAQRVVARP